MKKSFANRFVFLTLLFLIGSLTVSISNAGYLERQELLRYDNIMNDSFGYDLGSLGFDTDTVEIYGRRLSTPVDVVSEANQNLQRLFEKWNIMAIGSSPAVASVDISAHLTEADKKSLEALEYMRKAEEKAIEILDNRKLIRESAIADYILYSELAYEAATEAVSLMIEAMSFLNPSSSKDVSVGSHLGPRLAYLYSLKAKSSRARSEAYMLYAPNL